MPDITVSIPSQSLSLFIRKELDRLNMANCGSCGDGRLNQALAMEDPEGHILGQ